jgi:hypothetical protein
MKRGALLGLACLVVLSQAKLTFAEHARIQLTIAQLDAKTGEARAKATAAADTDPPAGGLNPRPLIKVKVNEPLVLQFVLTNTYPHMVREGVTVRYFLVREEKAGQKTVPYVGKEGVPQGRFKMNFKPRCRVGARVRFTIKERGLYLLRVETLNTQSDHEHFSAIDVQAE